MFYNAFITCKLQQIDNAPNAEARAQRDNKGLQSGDSGCEEFLFNRTMMNLLGENGVAAITIMIYSQFLLNTLYIGYSMGIAPIIGFNYGNRNDVQQKRVFSISMRFIGLASVLIFSISMFGGSNIVRLFADDISEVYQIAANGFTIFSYSFLFCGLNNFTSAMFTALSNGKVSAVFSFLRTFGLLGSPFSMHKIISCGGFKKLRPPFFYTQK